MFKKLRFGGTHTNSNNSASGEYSAGKRTARANDASASARASANGSNAAHALGKSRKRTILTALICALLCCVVGLSVSFAATNNKTTAQANVTSSTTIDFGKDGITSADSTNMTNLFNVLANKTSGATYNDVLERIKTTNLTAANFSSAKTVTLGGIKFNIMYVSKATAATTTANKGATGGSVNDVIVTLWMADVDTAGSTDYMSQWNPCYNASSNNDAIPTNMYSSSLIRSKLVGSKYVSNTTYTAGTLPNTTGTIATPWQPFSSTTGAFYNYLATPAQVSWQGTGLNTASYANGAYDATNNNFPNDTYAAPASGSFAANFNYTSKGSGDYAYGAWQNDKLWLPSLTETGFGANDTGATNTKGLWQTTQAQRSNSATTGNQRYAWLRSGRPGYANLACILCGTGAHSSSNVTYSRAVRPALHLNLKSAAKAAGLPAGESIAVNAPTFTTSTNFTLTDSNKTATTAWSSSQKELNVSVATGLTYKLPTGWSQDTTTPTKIKIPASAAVGTYTIDVTPANGYKWTGTTDDTTAATEKKSLTVTINNNQIDLPTITSATTVYYSATTDRTVTVSSTTGLTYTLPTNWTQSGATITIPKGTAVDTYTIKAKPSTGYVWKTDSTTTEKALAATVTVTNTSIAVPTFTAASASTTVISSDKETATAIFSTSDQTLTLSSTTGLTYSLPSGSPLGLNGTTVTIPANTAVNTNGYIINVTPQTGYKWTGTADKTAAANAQKQLTVILNSSDIEAPVWVANGSVYTLSDSNKTATMDYSSSNTNRTLKMNVTSGVTVGLPSGKSWSHADGSADISVPKTDVGTYTVTVSLKAGYKWKGEQSTAAKELKVVIVAAAPTTSPYMDAGTTYFIGRKLQTDYSGKLLRGTNDTAGTYSWTTDATISSAAYTAAWTFTSSDANYKSTTGTIRIDAVRELDTITATATATYTAFQTFDMNSLKVTANFKAGQSSATVTPTSVELPYTTAGRTNFRVADNNKDVIVKYKENGIEKSTTIKLTINPANPTTNPYLDTGTTYFIGKKLQTDYSGTLLSGLSDTAGAYSWTSDDTIDAETYTANWTFTSSDPDYKSTTGTITINAVRELDSITATATATYTAFQTFDMSSLVVTANFKGGVASEQVTVTANNVTLPYTADGRTNFRVADNNKNVTVTYEERGITRTATIKLTINPADPTTSPYMDTSVTYFIGRKLQSDYGGTLLRGLNDTAGAYSWTSDDTIDAETYTANWTFTSSDPDYKSTTGTITINAVRELDTITATATTAYTAFQQFDMNSLKVTANFKGGVASEQVTVTANNVTLPYTADNRTSFGVKDNNLSVVITYEERGITRTTFIQVTVTPATVTGLSFSPDSKPYDGAVKTIAVTGTIPAGISVQYYYKGTQNVFSGESKAGTYDVEARFTAGSGCDYSAPAQMEATLTITTKTVYDESVSGVALQYEYIGKLREIEPVVTVTLANGATTLQKNRDYVVSYDNTTDFSVGAIVNVTINFQGNYDGSWSKAYSIIKATVGYEILPSDGNYTYYYTGDEQGPSAALTHVAECDADTVVATLKYKGINGTVYAESADKPTDAGEYAMTVSLDGSYTNYNTFAPYTVEFEIKKATPDVVISVDYDGVSKLYVGSELPEITLVSATLGDLIVEGTLSWVNDNKLLVNTNTYTWKFTPKNTDNFEEVTGTEQFTAQIPTIISLTASWKDGTQPTAYTSTKLEDLRPYIVLMATLDTTDVIKISDYALAGMWGGGDTPTSAGNNQLEIMRDGIFEYLDIVYTAVAPERLDIDQSNAKTAYNAEEKFDKSTITVKVIYNDKSEKTLTESQFDVIYNDGNAFCYGDSKVTISYKEGNGTPVTAQVAITNVARLTYNTGGSLVWTDKTYDGDPTSATFTGTFTIGTLEIKYYEKQSDGTYTELVGVTEVTNVGTYKAVATFTITDARDKKNYYAVSAQEVEITISKADYDGVANIKFENNSADYDYGNVIPHGMAVENVPQDVTVTYEWKKGAVNADPDNITTAGTYTVTATFTVDSNHNDIPSMTATFTVNKIDPTVAEPSLNGLVQAGTYLRDLTFVGLPTDTAGTFTWDNPNYELVVGSNTLNYTFTPTDLVNYNVLHLQMTKNVVLKLLTGLGVSVTQHDVKLYSSYDLAKFVSLITTDATETDKILLTITAYYNDSTTETVTDNYEVYLLDGATTLKDGACKFGVKFEDKTYELATVNVIKVALESITATFDQNGKDIYSSGSVADILAYLADASSGVTLTVDGTNNDGNPNTDTLTYTLTADDDWTQMTASGYTSVTVTITGTTVKTTIQVYVTLKQLVEIELQFNQNGKPVYASNELDTVEDLLADATSGVTLTITAKYNDGDEQDVALADVTLSKDATFGDGDVVTVTYTDGVTVTKTFTVTVTPVQVTYITVVRDNPLSKIYTDTSFDDLRDMVTVTAHYNDGTQAETDDYEFSLADGSTKLTAGEIVITLTYTGDDKALYCQPLPRPVTVFKHDTVIDISGVQTEYTYTGDEQTVTGAEIIAGDDNAVLDYSANATFTDVPAGGRLTITVSVAEGENYLAASKQIEIIVNKAVLTITARDVEISFGDAPENDGVDITGFVGADDETVLNGELSYSYNYAQSGAAGDYVITVSGMSADNYVLNYVAGKLTVNKKSVEVVWTGTDVVYNGETHKPQATFEDIYGSTVAMTVTIKDENGNEIVTPVKSGTYIVTATVNNPNYEFENAETTFNIEAAEIRVKSSGDQWFDEQGLYTGQMVLITLDALDDDSNYKFISVSGLQDSDVEIKYSKGYLISDESVTIPSPSEETDYRRLKPSNIISAGRYIVNYKISAPNHDDYFGQWKIEIVDIEDPEAHYVIVLFNKPIDLTYGSVPATAEELSALAQKLVDEEYITVSGGLTAEQLIKATKLRLAVDNRNQVNSTTDVGNYTPYFEFTDEYKSIYEDYTIFYKQSNESENLNIGKVQLNRRVLSISWDETNFVYDGTARMPKATVTDKLTGETAEIEIVAGITNYQVKVGEITVELNIRIDGNVIEMGGYSLSVSIDDDNYAVENPFKTVSITSVNGGNPTTPSDGAKSSNLSFLKWLIPVAAGVIALAIIVAVVATRRRPHVSAVDDDGFNDDYEGDDFADVYGDY